MALLRIKRSTSKSHVLAFVHKLFHSPCRMSMTSKQPIVKCLFCETNVADLDPRTSAPSYHPEVPAVCLECATSGPVAQFTDYPSKLEKTLTWISSRRTSLGSLKAFLCKLRKNVASNKESLLGEITSADSQLYYSALFSLEKTKWLVASANTEKLARLEKLQKDPLMLERKRVGFLWMANDKEMSSTDLKELERSARKLLGQVSDLQMNLESRKYSGFEDYLLAQNFETIQAAIKNLSLVTSNLENVCNRLALLSTRCQTLHRKNHAPIDVAWDVNPRRIFVKHLPEAITDYYFHEYFSKFGFIAEVSLWKHTRKPSPLRVGFITFLKADSVRRVLDTQPHQLGGTQFVVCLTMRRRSNDRRPLVWVINPRGILVGNLTEATDDCVLHEYFSKFGLISDVYVLKDTRWRDSRRSGIVIFREVDAVKKVFDSQPHLLNAAQLTVALATNKNSNYTESRTQHGISNEGASQLTSDTTTIFVSRLTPTTSETDLAVYFSKFGSVSKASIVTDRVTGRPRGYGFVTFTDKKAFEGGVLEVCHFLNCSHLNVRLKVSSTLFSGV